MIIRWSLVTSVPNKACDFLMDWIHGVGSIEDLCTLPFLCKSNLQNLVGWQLWLQCVHSETEDKQSFLYLPRKLGSAELHARKKTFSFSFGKTYFFLGLYWKLKLLNFFSFTSGGCFYVAAILVLHMEGTRTLLGDTCSDWHSPVSKHDWQFSLFCTSSWYFAIYMDLLHKTWL